MKEKRTTLTSSIYINRAKIRVLDINRTIKHVSILHVLKRISFKIFLKVPLSQENTGTRRGVIKWKDRE